jgi:hypothetical protein
MIGVKSADTHHNQRRELTNHMYRHQHAVMHLEEVGFNSITIVVWVWLRLDSHQMGFMTGVVVTIMSMKTSMNVMNNVRISSMNVMLVITAAVNAVVKFLSMLTRMLV